MSGETWGRRGQKPSPAGAYGEVRRPLLLATRDLWLVGVDQQRLAFAADRALVHDDLLDVREGGKVEHDVQQGGLDDRAQPAGAGAALERALGDRLQGMLPEFEFDAF